MRKVKGNPKESRDSEGSAIDEPDEVVTFDQAVDFLGTSKPTLYRLKQGDIQGLKVGRQWRFRKTDMVAHMERKPTSIARAPMQELEAELAIAEEELRRLELELPPKVSFKSPESDLASADQQKVIQLLNSILKLALHAQASNIHFEPQKDGVQVRLRMDGVLQVLRRLPTSLLQPIVDRLKLMADMSIEEKRVPQDGRICIKLQDKDFDIRISSCPTVYGESMVMRVLEKSNTMTTLDQLNMEADDQVQLQKWLNAPNGMVLVAGPSGSGKTTMLYSCLNEVNEPVRKIMTIEDPVESSIPGTIQVHVNRKAGVNFANTLRAFLRQDPDVILVGEIRDQETGEVASQAALTGHLVLTSLPANSAVDAVLRLRDMGLESYLISSALVGITSQRLARRVCENCKEEDCSGADVPASLQQLASSGGYVIPKDARFYRGKGCDACRETGYKGRIMIYELMEWSAALSQAFLQGASRDELVSLAVAKTLIANGVLKAAQGLTTLDEVQRVLGISG